MRNPTERIRCFSCGGQIRTKPGAARAACQHCGAETITPSDAPEREAVRLSDLGRSTLVRSETLPCQSCGAEFSAGQGVLSTVCPFCDTALIRTDVHVHHHLPIRQVIPFRLDEDAAKSSVAHFLDGATSISRKRQARILNDVKLQPVFLSYYLFDADLELKTRVRDATTFADFDSLARQIELAGWVEGFLVPGCETQGIFASTPSVDGQAWHLGDLQNYDAKALAGAIATFPAFPVQEAADSAADHLDAVVSTRIRTELAQNEEHGPLRYRRKDEWVRAVLVPVWLGQYIVDGQSYRVRVNGQTGEAGVEVPAPRDADFIQIIFYAIGAICVLIYLFLLGEDSGLWQR